MSKSKCECPEMAPAWMCTYSDLCSLLLCFFVLIVSMSSTDPNDFAKASGALRGSLGILSEDPSTMELISVIMPKVADVDVGEVATALTKLQDFVEQGNQQESFQVVITSTGIDIRILTPLLFEGEMTELDPRGLPYLVKVFDVARGWG